MFKKLSILLAAVLCVSCMFAGFTMAAETASEAEAEGESGGEEAAAALIAILAASSTGEAADTETADAQSADAEATGESTGDSGDSSAAMASMLELFGIEFDAEAFYADLDERMEAGEELTVEDVIPQEYLEFFAMMFGGGAEGAPYDIEIGCDENLMYFYWIFNEEQGEEECEEIASSVAESFESDETMASLKNAMEALSDSYDIDIYDIEFTLAFYNADDSEIYEMTYTYEDLEDLEAEDAAIDEEIEELLGDEEENAK